MAAVKSSAGSGLTRKLGPLPVWAWAGVGVVAILVVYKLYKSKQLSAAQATAPASTDTLGTGAQDAGLAGSTLGGSPAPDLSPILDTLSQTTGLVQSQEALISELANGAYTVAQTAQQQLGSLAAGDQGLLATFATNQSSAAAAPNTSAMNTTTSGGSPAYTAAPDIEANLGAIAAGARSAVSDTTPVPAGTKISGQTVYRQAQGVNVINAPGGAGGRLVIQ